MAERKKKKFNWHEVRVGFFVIGSFAILVLMIFRVSGGRGLFTPRTTAITYLPTLEGLKPGAPVWLNGIEIGNVEGFSIDKTLPATKANEETRNKIKSIQSDLQRYEDTIKEIRNRIEDEKTKLKAASADTRQHLQDTLTGYQDRLDSIKENRRKLEEDLKTQRGNLQSIRLVLKIDDKFTYWIKKDSEVTIGSIGLLGDKYVDISIGRTDVPPRKTKEGYIFIEGINEATMRQLMVGANDLIANFGEISETIKSITTKLDTGQGTIGQLINSSALHDSLTATIRSLGRTVNDAGTLMTSIQDGKGTLGQMIQNRQLYDEINGTLAEIRNFVSKLNQSQGTLNKLIQDPALYNNIRQLTAKIDTILARIEKGEGTVGKLTVDDTLYVEARDSLQKIREILVQIDQGRGTIGMLLKDKQLYDNLNEALAELVKLTYDIRKNPKKYLKIKFSIF